MAEVQLKTRLIFQICDPELDPGDEPEAKQFPNRVHFSVPEEFQVLAVRTGSTWVEVGDGEQPSPRDLRAAARAVLTDEMIATGSATIAPTGEEHIEYGPFWKNSGGGGGTPMTLFAVGEGEDAGFRPFSRAVGSGGGSDPLEQAVLRVSIAVSQA